MYFSLIRKKVILSLITKTVTNKTLKITAQLLYALYAGKSFERLIFNEIFSFSQAKNLLLPNQSGFEPGDSCINHVHLVMMDLKLEVFSWIYLKPSIKSGMNGLNLNLSKMVF